MYCIDIITLFPDTVGDVLSESILGRAQERDFLRIATHQLRDYTVNKQKQVDDYPYGGGRGAVLQADPLFRCWDHLRGQGPGRPHTIYLSPCGKTFTQADAKRLAWEHGHLILVCGHYEGIDQRFIDECVDEEISLGDFVLTGGEIAAMAGVSVPEGTRVLLSRQTTVGRDNPYAREKLCPVLAFYVEAGWEDACARCIQILRNEGAGHTMTIHSQDESVIREFALRKPVSRLLVNTAGALGGVGATTGLPPALTLGCGAVGGSASSDNIGPMNLLNIRRVAWGLRELGDLREPAPAPRNAGSCAPRPGQVSREEIEAIARAVVARLTEGR